jgi:serine/threonine protein kinase
MARDQQHGVVIGDDHANPVDDVNVLDMSEPVTTTVGTSAFVTASTDFLMSGHNIEVGCPSHSNSVAECRSEYFSTRIEKMIQARKEFASDLEFEVEASRVHWSELTPLNVEAANEVNLQGLKLESNDGKELREVDDEVGETGGAGETAETNMEVFLRLRKKYGGFFQLERTPGIFWNGKIAEGGQAEIFSITETVGLHAFTAVVLKVFKEGSSLRDLEKQWPLGMLQNKHLTHFGLHHLGQYTCPIMGAYLLNDGRFAFCMPRCGGDLRKLIDLKMQENHNQGPPFTSAGTKRIILQIAEGMCELHEHDIVHRDLKAANVLLNTESATGMEDPYGFVCQVAEDPNAFACQVLEDPNAFTCQVADFECSVGVVGTGFWRAPEILQAVKSRNIKPELFTKSADVYSYGMTCYEIVTGRMPFEDLRASDYDVVIRGGRPKLPSDIEPWMRDLIIRCWHPNPLERPTSKTIVRTIASDGRYGLDTWRSLVLELDA